VKILNDNINLLIVLLFASLAYITIFNGRWYDKVKLTDVYNTDKRIRLSENTMVDPSYSIESGRQEFTIDAEISILNDSLTIDSLVISLTEIGDEEGYKNVQVAVVRNIEEKSSAIHHTFSYENSGSHRFTVSFNSRESTGKLFRASIDLKKTKNFELTARNNSNIIIVLYPALWVAFGVLLLVKITNLVRKDDPDDKTGNEEPEEERFF
jgi:hypothetical protein